MTALQIELIQDSWKKVAPISLQAGELFYQRLFEIAPEVQPLFIKTDTKSQAKKLMSVLGMVVSQLHQLDTIIDKVKSLGVQHNDYGVKDEHYQKVGEALLWTLETGLGDFWNESLKEAWATAYFTLADVMKSAQKEALQPA